jgi:hypothetical protein
MLPARHLPPLLWLGNEAMVCGVVLERLDLAAFGSRFWIYGRSGDGTGEEGGASGMEDEMT